MPLNSDRASVSVVIGRSAAAVPVTAVASATGTPGNGPWTVTVRNDGSTATTNAIATGTDWANAVRANPRPSRGSAQPRAMVRMPSAAAKPSARGLASVDNATPGFQAKNASPPAMATVGTMKELRGNDARLRR